MRLRHVIARCVIGSLYTKLSFGGSSTTAATAMTPSNNAPDSFSICRQGTRPMYIIKYTTRNKSAAVEKFSVRIRKPMTPVITSIYLMARDSVPSFR